MDVILLLKEYIGLIILIIIILIFAYILYKQKKNQETFLKTIPENSSYEMGHKMEDQSKPEPILHFDEPQSEEFSFEKSSQNILEHIQNFIDKVDKEFQKESKKMEKEEKGVSKMIGLVDKTSQSLDKHKQNLLTQKNILRRNITAVEGARNILASKNDVPITTYDCSKCGSSLKEIDGGYLCPQCGPFKWPR